MSTRKSEKARAGEKKFYKKVKGGKKEGKRGGN